MQTIAKNKVKLNNHIGMLTPVIKKRLEKFRKESKNWKPIWTGDNGYKKFEMHGHPTNHVVDLGKGLCTCQFWMLKGIPCVHACATLSRVNKPPEDFCHCLLTMESYRETYNHHINPIPGQLLWEHVEEYNKPHAPKIKRKPEKLQMKRRIDADEKGGGGSKKSKADPKPQSNNGDNVHLKRQLGPLLAVFVRGCKKKRACDAAAVAAAAAAEADKKKKNEGGVPASEQQLQQPQDDGDQRDGEDNPLVQFTEIALATSDAQPVEIGISQPTASNIKDSQKDHGIKRPSKLSPRRRSSPLATSVPVNPMQGASSGTVTRLVNYMKFIPTPGFKAPRKKN
ncbi:hypothetical protein Ahy_B03g062828 [Arachis hypogaea]|uniref:SWIM-type domain-containing protein n=1 Tax=Arachis hypogaea TaxID=3818 RepID=A0A444ZVX9_ARAHY|nr:hypothetical protein Ahy_B03g062828 [Arachis hypogaea]